MPYDQVWFHWGEFTGKGNSQCKRHEERASFQADGWSWSRVSQGRMEAGGQRTAMARFSIALWVTSRFWIWFVWQEVIRGFWKEGAYIWASLVAQTVKNLPAIQETQVQSLKKGVATHSRILAWRFSWTEKLYSPWGHRVGHEWATNTYLFSYLCFKRSNLAFLWKINFDEARMNTQTLRKRILMPLFQ